MLLMEPPQYQPERDTLLFRSFFDKITHRELAFCNNGTFSRFVHALLMRSLYSKVILNGNPKTDNCSETS